MKRSTQGLLLGLEEEDLELEPVVVQFVEDGVELLEVVAAADVGDHRGPLHGAALVPEQLAQ